MLCQQSKFRDAGGNSLIRISLACLQVFFNDACRCLDSVRGAQVSLDVAKSSRLYEFIREANPTIVSNINLSVVSSSPKDHPRDAVAPGNGAAQVKLQVRLHLSLSL